VVTHRMPCPLDSSIIHSDQSSQWELRQSKLVMVTRHPTSDRRSRLALRDGKVSIAKPVHPMPMTRVLNRTTCTEGGLGARSPANTPTGAGDAALSRRVRGVWAGAIGAMAAGFTPSVRACHPLCPGVLYITRRAAEEHSPLETKYSPFALGRGRRRRSHFPEARWMPPVY
jgi:hypothetical protein